MFKNYFKVACRNLYRNKLYSIIGTVGLSLGIACCILILLYSQHEFSYDRFHDNAGNIYRVIHNESGSGGISDGTSSTSPQLAPHLRDAFPEIVGVTPIAEVESAVTSGNISFYQTIVAVTPDFFEMFSFPLIKGNAASVLDDPGAVVLTAEVARKYFGNDDPIGKTVTLQLGETQHDFFVSGIIQEAPVNSSLQYDMLLSTEMLKYVFPEDYL
jgi:putative ABC transport system permease protein